MMNTHIWNERFIQSTNNQNRPLLEALLEKIPEVLFENTAYLVNEMDIGR